MWGQGYVTDVEYTSNFFSVLAPSHLRFMLALKGIDPSSSGAEFDYMELGFGQGLTLSVLAAANPKARFWGNDFNPTHVQRARARAEAAGLANVTFLERSFADLGEAGLPQMDFIILHGIYSWISTDNQRAIRHFLDRHLKPGGVAYVSYNILPGWSPLAPMQWLARTYAERIPGGSAQRLKASLDFLQKLKGTDAGYFRQNQIVSNTLDKIASTSTNYIVHEYLNEHWHLLSHHEMCGHMAEAKLSYAGSADTVDILEHFLLHAPARAVLDEMSGDPLRETVKDFLRNNNFRRDIFIRGGVAQPDRRRAQAVAGLSVALVRPLADCSLEVKFPIGTVHLAAERHQAILEALARRPHTLGELAAPAGNPDALISVARAVTALVAAGYVAPCAAGWQGAPDPAAAAASARLNRVLLDAARDDGTPNRILVSPVTGSAVGVEPAVQRLLLGGAAAAGQTPESRRQAEERAAVHRPLFATLALAAASSVSAGRPSPDAEPR